MLLLLCLEKNFVVKTIVFLPLSRLACQVEAVLALKFRYKV